MADGTKKRGRPRGAKNEANGAAPKEAAPKARAAATTPEPGHNKPELTDDEQRALLFQHKRRYETALAEKKDADAAFKNACKRAKAECGVDAVADIKDAIAFAAPNGQQLFVAEVERKQRVARWLGLPVGSQVEFNFTDRAPQDEREFELGKQAGMAGENCKPADTVRNPARWVEGWHQGQDVLKSAFLKVEKAAGAEDAEALDDLTGAANGEDDDADLRPDFLKRGSADASAEA